MSINDQKRYADSDDELNDCLQNAYSPISDEEYPNPRGFGWSNVNSRVHKIIHPENKQTSKSSISKAIENNADKQQVHKSTVNDKATPKEATNQEPVADPVIKDKTFTHGAAHQSQVAEFVVTEPTAMEDDTDQMQVAESLTIERTAMEEVTDQEQVAESVVSSRRILDLDTMSELEHPLPDDKPKKNWTILKDQYMEKLQSRDLAEDESQENPTKSIAVTHDNTIKPKGRHKRNRMVRDKVAPIPKESLSIYIVVLNFEPYAGNYCKNINSFIKDTIAEFVVNEGILTSRKSRRRITWGSHPFNIVHKNHPMSEMNYSFIIAVNPPDMYKLDLNYLEELLNKNQQLADRCIQTAWFSQSEFFNAEHDHFKHCRTVYQNWINRKWGSCIWCLIECHL